MISDLLPHIADEHNQKSILEGHTGEMMNIILGSEPVPTDDVGSAVKDNIIRILLEKYGFEEEDFLSSELEIVPAFEVKDVGLDCSLIGGYGHDDKVCAYAALQGLFDAKDPQKTAFCVFVDKEEIGKIGISSMRSRVFDFFLEDLCRQNACGMGECVRNSFCMSADVTAAYDLNFADSFELLSTARLNHGVAVCKYTGTKGKEAASDASAELMACLRKLFAEQNVVWQTGEMGRIDLGGGGTVALEMANRGIDTIDAGVPMLSMHAPFELVAKADCYMTYKAAKAVFSLLNI